MGKCKNEQEVMETPEYVRYKGKVYEVIGVSYEEHIYQIVSLDTGDFTDADDEFGTSFVRWENCEAVAPRYETLENIRKFAQEYPVGGFGFLPVDIVAKEGFVPECKTPFAAGYDLKADIDKDIVLQPMQIACIPVGFKIAIPQGHEAQIRPRSGLAVKHGITVLNSPGTIDADYRGWVHAPLINLGSEPYTVHPGERIAQMVIAKHEVINPNLVDNLDDTERGDGAFGHTGK